MRSPSVTRRTGAVDDKKRLDTVKEPAWPEVVRHPADATSPPSRGRHVAANAPSRPYRRPPSPPQAAVRPTTTRANRRSLDARYLSLSARLERRLVVR
jgi:hypothetical protein